MAVIFDPSGKIVPGSIRNTRREARRHFADSMGVARWGDLWELGYRVGRWI